MPSKAVYKLSELFRLGITSPSIQMDRCHLRPECSLQNSNTMLVNFRDASKFPGTRSTSAITRIQYWQVKVEMESAAVAALVNTPLFAEFGVATFTEPDAADSSIAKVFSNMVRLGSAETVETTINKKKSVISAEVRAPGIQNFPEGRAPGIQNFPEGRAPGRQCFPLIHIPVCRNKDIVWTCGILVNSDTKRVTILDISGRQQLSNYSFNEGDLYAVFDIFHLKDSIGGEIKLSIETGKDIVLSHKIASILAKAVGSNIRAIRSKTKRRSTKKRVRRVAVADADARTRKKTPSSKAKTKPDLTENRGRGGKNRKDPQEGELASTGMKKSGRLQKRAGINTTQSENAQAKKRRKSSS